ncbi:MAG: hypothetical protein H7A24_04060 [Leptospiraceae bacterium]|nr:hypothetical protein [Leptospiraceae bacterium]MCP5511028.1 hypothetical protein [Leptospiraceae bacterium]
MSLEIQQYLVYSIVLLAIYKLFSPLLLPLLKKDKHGGKETEKGFYHQTCAKCSLKK